MAAGLSQQVLADLINVTYQHVQSYEAGTNRITAARLYDIARALKVDIGCFYEGLAVPQRQASILEQDLFLDLARSFQAIRDAKHRDAICLLARILARCAGRPTDSR